MTVVCEHRPEYFTAPLLVKATPTSLPYSREVVILLTAPDEHAARGNESIIDYTTRRDA